MYDSQYQHSYLLLGLAFLGVWTLLYVRRRDVRKKMRIMSTIVAVMGPIADTVYVQDWWSPLIVINTEVGFEPILAGFAIGGIAAALYQSVYRKTVIVRTERADTTRIPDVEFACLLASPILLLFGCFYLLRFNSFESTLVAALIPLAIMFLRRPDLLPVSLTSGALLVVVASLVYTFVELLTPGWVRALWHFDNVPDIIIVGLPIDDVVFYFLTGALIGPIYEYWNGLAFLSGAKDPSAQHI